MRYAVRSLVGAGALVLLAGCSDDVREITATPPPTATVEATEVPVTPTEVPTQAATATATVLPTDVPATEIPTPVPTSGPVVSHLGLASAENRPIESSGTDPSGRAIYEVPLGTGLNLIVEGRSGADNLPPGINGFNPDGLPDMQVLLSRPLGDGTLAVCDVDPDGVNGGVPAVDPPVFSDSGRAADAMNDLGCRVNDGTGQPIARQTSNQACTQFASGVFSFVEQTSSIQFCLPIARAWAFPQGDTIVTARLRSVSGSLGPSEQMVVRVERALPPVTPGPNAPSPEVTHFGLAAADDRILEPAAFDSEGRPIYTRLFGHAFSLIVEAAPNPIGLPVGIEAFDPQGMAPDLQILHDRDLGDGNREVCDVDIEAGVFGGIPGTSPLEFSDDPEVLDAINDLGCRVNDGTGQPHARQPSNQACTRDGFGNFSFASESSVLQYCLPIAKAWEFPPGDTIVAARVRSIDGGLSEVAEIVIRVDDEDVSGDCEAGGPGLRIFSVNVDGSSLTTSITPGDPIIDGVAESALLCAGPSDDGVYPLRVVEDFAVGFRMQNDDVLCIGFDAAGSSGVLDCAGSEALDVIERLDPSSRVNEGGLGVPTGTGAALLEIDAFFRTMPAGFDPNDCAGLRGSRMPVLLTTANATSEVDSDDGTDPAVVSVDGRPFDCDDWNRSDGPGELAMPLGALSTVVGDIANVFVFAD